MHPEGSMTRTGLLGQVGYQGVKGGSFQDDLS